MSDLAAERDLKAATALIIALQLGRDEDVPAILSLCDPGAVASILALTLVNLLREAGNDVNQVPTLVAEHLRRAKSA